jgi:hypothetical protein
VPLILNLGVLNVNSPQPSSAFVIGESIINGMDANRKQNLNLGGMYGFANAVTGNVNNILDSFEMVDGVIFDQDIKPSVAGNV